jgi:hypothetical protein
MILLLSSQGIQEQQRQACTSSIVACKSGHQLISQDIWKWLMAARSAAEPRRELSLLQPTFFLIFLCTETSSAKLSNVAVATYRNLSWRTTTDS